MTAAILTISLKTLVISPSCDLKFPCLCSFNCLLPSVLTTALWALLIFAVIFLVGGRGHFNQLNKLQKTTFLGKGFFWDVIAYAAVLITLTIVYGGIWLFWLPLYFLVGLAAVFFARAMQL